jgi:predicted AlkP superfamily pyrophosphatase or phosphodiesterase
VLDRHLRELDATDGALDERWNDDTLSEDSYTFTGNPAFAAYQGDAARAIASREPIGQDEVTDLLFVELKTADVAGHIWNMLNPQVGAVLKVQDQTLEELVKILDRRVGRGEYVLAMTADHGQSPVPDAVGGLRIDRSLLLEDVNAEFGSVVEALHPGDLYAREAEPNLLEEMARFIGDYRFVDGMPPGPSIGEAPGDRLDERVFAAALPGWFLLNLTEAEINGLGPGHHEEGDLWVPVEL